MNFFSTRSVETTQLKTTLDTKVGFRLSFLNAIFSKFVLQFAKPSLVESSFDQKDLSIFFPCDLRLRSMYFLGRMFSLLMAGIGFGQNKFYSRSIKKILFLLILAGSITQLNAQIAQRGTATTAIVGTANSSSLSINKPTGVVAGNVLIASILQNETDNDNGGLGNATLSGWTLVDGRTIRSEGTNDGDNAWYGTVLFRVADGTEGSSFSFTLPNSRADMAIGSIVAFSGVTSSLGVKADGTAGGPFDIDPGTLNVITSNQSTSTATGVTTVTANSAVVMLSMANNNRTYSDWVATNPSSLTELFDNNTEDGDDGSVGGAWAISSTAGATGNGTVTLSGNARTGALFLILRPCTLAAAAASSTPTLCINTALTNITHTTTGATGIGTATGLPSGVTASWASNTITISGTPTASGTFNYSIPLTGGCGSVNATGTITVNSFFTTTSQTFNANGTYTVPAGVRQVTVQAWGGGGAGGGTANAGDGNANGGGGGGGGAYATKVINVTPGQTLSIQVGAGGSGVSAGNGGNGGNSTITGFDTEILAEGGKGGISAIATSGNPLVSGGSAGLATNSIGTTTTSGSNGGNGTRGNDINSGAGGASPNGGAGGVALSGLGSSNNGNSGTAPGGGGSGSRTSQNNGSRIGGAGGVGRIIVSGTNSIGITNNSSTTVLSCGQPSISVTAFGGLTYSWSGGNTTNTAANTFTTAGNYTVTVFNADGCSAQESITITGVGGTVPAVPTINASGVTTFCAGGSVMLSSSSVSGNQWYKDGVAIGSATNQTYSATASGSYTAIVTASSCSSAASAGTTITVSPTSVAGSVSGGGVICTGSNKTLTLTGNTGSIQWQSSADGTNYSNIENANVFNYTSPVLNANTYYKAVVTSGACASATTSAATVSVKQSGAWIGATSTDWNTAQNWCGSIIPTASTDVTITSETLNQPIISSANAAVKNLIIATGAQLTINTSRNLEVWGDWTIDGTFTTSNSTVNFKKVGDQAIGGANVSIFNNISIEGGGSKAISKDVEITGAVTFTSGYITSTNSSKLIFKNGSSVASGVGAAKDASFAMVQVVKTGTDAFTFPVGGYDATHGYRYHPIEISTPSSNSTFSAQYYRVNPITVYTAPPTGVLTDLSDHEYWDLSKTSGTSSVDVTLHWNAYSGAVANQYILQTGLVSVVVAHYKLNNWYKEGETSTPHTIGSAVVSGNYAVSGSVKVLGVSTFSPFTIGSTNAALPVMLTSFTAKPTTNNTVSLNWTTSSEIVNKGFRIERQAGGINGKFETLGFVASKANAGNSQTALYYNFIDASPRSGANTYYRLAQEDLGGKTTLSEVRVVKLNNETVTMVFPNPSNGAVNISRTANGKKMNVQVIDMAGRMIQQFSNITDSNFKLNISKSGMYNIKMTYPETGEQSVQRIVVEK